MIPQVILLCFEFFKTGLFSIGGGLATLPFLYDISRRTGWYTTSDISDMIAISESTPGPLGVNMSTYIGFKMYGVWGGILTTIMLVLPSVIVIILVARLLDKFRDSKYVMGTMYGIRPASFAMICVAAVTVTELAFVSNGALSIKALILGVIIALTYWKFKLHPIFYICAAAAVGIIFKF